MKLVCTGSRFHSCVRFHERIQSRTSNASNLTVSCSADGIPEEGVAGGVILASCVPSMVQRMHSGFDESVRANSSNFP